MSQSDAELRISANSDEVKTGMDKAVHAVREGSNQMKESLEGFNQKIERVMGTFKIFTEALIIGAIGEQFVEMVKKSAEAGDELLKTSQKVGMSVDNLSKLKYAASLSDVAFDSLSTGLKKLSANMAMAQQGSLQQKDAFEALGIKVADSTGRLRSLDQVFPELVDRFSKMQDGTTKTALAMQIFGKAGADMIPLLNSGTASLQEMGAEAERLGLVWDTASAQAAERMNDNITRMHASMDGIAKNISMAMIPAFNAVALAMSESAAKGGLLNMAFQALAAVIKYTTVVIIGIKNALTDLAIVVKTVFELLTSDTDPSVIWRRMKDEIAKTNEEANKLANEVLHGPTVQPGEKADGGGEKAPVLPTHGGAGDKSRVSEWKAELQDMKQASGEYFKSNMQAEIDFWNQKLTLIRGNGKKEIEERRQVNAELYNLHKQLAQEQRQIDEANIDHKKKMDQLEVDMEAEDIRMRKELGQISDEQSQQQLAALEDRKYQIERAGIEKRLQLLKDDQVQQAKLKQQLEELERNHALKVKKIQDDAIIAQRNSAQQMMQPITGAVETSIKGVILGTTTMQKALSNLWQAILGEFVNNMVKNMVAHWANAEATKTAASAAGNTARTSMAAAAATTSAGINTTEAMTSVGSHAAGAAAGAADSVASIPYVGPVMAAAAFASVMSMVMGAKSSIPSASAGFDIPAGVNPLTQLHQREMVLPAKYADTIRSMSEGGTAGGGSTHITIQAVDAAGVHRLLMSHGGALVDSLKNQARNFRTVG